MPMSCPSPAPSFDGRASELDALLSDMKSSAAPDPARIEKLRVQIDQALDAKTISVRDWRTLVEKCSKIRRAPRG